MKRYLLLLALLLGSLCARAAGEPRIIHLPEKPTDVQTFAASELQKYIYQRTHRLLPIRTGSSASTPALRLATDTTLGPETYAISRENNSLTICGGSDIALLYGSYAYAEYLGVRFALHGDILPDTPFDRSLLDCPTGRHTPLFAIRGLLPFHDFPEGPDLWDEDMYKACLSQMVKMKMNFFSLHTYPHVEPNVWIGQPGDVRADGTVTHSYPTTLANTARAGAWGYSAMDTRTYSSGAATLFADSVYQSPLLDGASPWPRTPEQMNLIFDRTGQLFHNAFSLGRDLGIRFCVGVETPLSVPKEVADRLREQGRDPYAPETIADLYRGIFTRITRTHPIDYFWLWTPEEWTWGTPSDASIRNTIADVRIAREVLSNEFDSLGFGLSGWVLGPPDNRCLFDTILPSGDFLASLSRLCGQERLDLGYAQLPAQRKRVPVLWLEDDPALTTPQFWVGRLRSDLAECHGIGCHGVIANFWRTGSIAPNLMAYAQACWEQQEWNPDFGKPYTPAPETKSDLRLGGVGTNYYHYIRGTEDQYLFNTQRYDLEGYRINLPNGTYRITFLFSETRYKSAGERIFDISIEGEPLLTDIDVFARAGSDSASGSATPMCIIHDLRYLEMTLNVDELQILSMQVGQDVRITADAVPDKTFEGVVTNVSSNGTTTAGTTTYPVTIRIDDYGELLPGMNATAEIEVESADNALSIPNGAVIRGNYVLITADSPSAAGADPAMTAPEGYVYVKVTTGVSDNDYIEVTSGLTEADTVAYEASAPFDFGYAQPGMTVTVAGG